MYKTFAQFSSLTPAREVELSAVMLAVGAYLDYR